MIEHLEYIPFIMSIGNLIFNGLILPIENPGYVLDYISIAFSLICALLPM
jgi:hypothetical protein